MKKRNVVVIVLIIAMLLMGSAYALWTDSVSIDVTAKSASMDVKIVGRTADNTSTSDIGQIAAVAAIDPTTGVDTVSEVITRFIPGETMQFVYTIQNKGTINVKLTGFNFADADGASNGDLRAVTHVTWLFDDGAVTSTGNDLIGNIGNTTIAENIVLTPGDTCTLTLDVKIQDPSPNTPYTYEKQSVFTISPQFVQSN